MPLDNRQTFHGVTDSVAQPDAGPIFIGANADLRAYQQTVIATANTASGNLILNLPALGEAAGRIYSIRVSIANTRTVIVRGAGFTPIAYSVSGDHLYYCDGFGWKELATV